MKMFIFFKKTFIFMCLTIFSVFLLSCEKEQEDDAEYIPESEKNKAELVMKIVENNPNGFEIDNEWFRYYSCITFLNCGKRVGIIEGEIIGLGTSLGDELGTISQFYGKYILYSYDSSVNSDFINSDFINGRISTSYYKEGSYYNIYEKIGGIEGVPVVKTKTKGNPQINENKYLDFHLSFIDKTFTLSCKELILTNEFYSDLITNGIFQFIKNQLTISFEDGNVYYCYYFDENYKIYKIVSGITTNGRHDNGHDMDYTNTISYTILELTSPMNIEVPTEYDEEFIDYGVAEKFLDLIIPPVQ